MDIRHFILSPDFSLRGWKRLPYAIQSVSRPVTFFFSENEWELLTLCNGHTPMDWEKLTVTERDRLIKWEKAGFIVPCGSDESLAAKQEYRFYPARFKEKVQWSITGRCNFKCRHCFMSAPHALHGEPSFGQLMTMLDAFERCGIKGVELTGGEPLIRPDLWRITDEILRRGMVIPTIYTNGLLVSDDFLDGLESRNIRPAIQVSFDGVGHHDWMRGVQGAEKAVTDALIRCQKRGFPTFASMVLCRENVGSIRETVNRLAELGCLGVKICGASPQGEWLSQREHYLTQAQIFAAFLDYLPHYFEDGLPLSIGLEGFFSYDKFSGTISAFSERNVPENRFGRSLLCADARREMYVSPRGKVLPCMLMAGGAAEEMFPNMLETPLEEILDSGSFYMETTDLRVSDFMAHNPECQSCGFRSQCCGGCRAVAQRESPGDFLAINPVTCQYFKDGWHERKTALLRDILERN